MPTTLDHVVIWCDDPLRSVDFYGRVVGLPGVRVEEYREGRVPFPSVRVSADSLIDLMPRTIVPGVDAMAGASGTAGHPVNHVCLAMTGTEFDGLLRRLADAGTQMSAVSEGSFGAQGAAARACYFVDPDRNVIEVRCYP